MGAESHKRQSVGGGFAVDQHQVGSQVTVPKSRQVSGQGVIAVLGRQCRVGEQQPQDGAEFVVKDVPAAAFTFAFVVLLELGGAAKRPLGADRPLAHPRRRQEPNRRGARP